MEEFRGMKLLPTLALFTVALSMSVDFAGAVDILFWSRAKCTGIVNPLCDSISAGTCCGSAIARQSVQFQAMRDCYSAVTYKNGGCNTTVSTMSGNVCFDSPGATYTGARWFSNCIRPRRALMLAHESKDDCPKGGSRQGHSNVIYYRDDPSKGIWTLRREENATGIDLYEQLDSVPDAEKVNWLTAHGATYDSKTEGQIMVFVDPSSQLVE